MNKIDVVVIYEDDTVLAINKPAGLLVHADGSSNDVTLVDWVVGNYPAIEGVGESQTLKDGTVVTRPGIVHRLDRDTSGVMLIAKTDESYQNLKQQFKDRVIKKAYLALCYDTFKNDKAQGTIDLEIGRSPTDFRRWSAQPGSRGKKRSAVTEYFLLEQTNSHSLLFCQPLTGRTHQIRVHLKAIHHPIVCDSLYAPKRDCIDGLNRQALHARAISWVEASGQYRQVVAPLPDDFQAGLGNLGFKYQSQ